MVDVVLETHCFLDLWFPQRQISWESVSSNLQLAEFASRLEDQEEDQEYDFERGQIDLRLGIRLLNREIVGSKRTVTKQVKLEAHLLLGLGARFQMLSAQSSITDGICRMLVRNNEGNRKTQQKQTNNSQHREAWVIDSISEFRCWKTILKPMFLVILRLRTNERLLRTRVFMTLDFIISVKCVLKLILLVISRLRPF